MKIFDDTGAPAPFLVGSQIFFCLIGTVGVRSDEEDFGSFVIEKIGWIDGDPPAAFKAITLPIDGPVKRRNARRFG